MLIGLVVAAVLVTFGIWMSITKPAPNRVYPPSLLGSGTPIQATVPVQAINEMVDLQLAKKNTPLQDVQLSLAEPRVRTDLTLSFWGRTLGVTVWMKPTVESNGDLRLTAEQVQMGSWPIPLKTLFAVLEGLPWPPWVHVQPAQYTVDFALSERVSGNGYHYRIQDIDWAQNSIDMQIYLQANKSS